MKLLILPHQLFNIKYHTEKYEVVLWECPYYFTRYNFNKKKLILHRASMKYYYDYLKKSGYKVKYIEYKNVPDKKDNYIMFDPIDKLKLKGLKISYIESPNFLLTKEDYKKYRNKTKHFLFNNFYKWGKKILDVIPDIKSQDKLNRKKLPSKVNVPPTKTFNTASEKKYINEAIKYVNKNFKNNYGNSDNFIYPISHKSCDKWLKNWVSKRFKLFGDYQDSIDEKDSFLFHSVLSSSINCGLLNPLEIIKYISKHKKKIPMNSYEGYIRQIFWREYQRYCYIYYNFYNKSYFMDKKTLTKKWYTGNVGVKPIDDCIVKAFDNGYLNHIERLMVMGNFMVLFGIAPKQGFKWFMEMSCDSYEWVMCQNVLDMVFFVSGGVTMRRPYVSSSNYILKMSNYKKGDWCDIWAKYYKDFKKKKRSKLLKFRYFFKGL